MVIKHAMYEILSNSAPWVLLPFHEMLKPLNNQRGGDEVNVSDAHYSAAFGDSLVEDLCGTQDFNGAGNRSIPLEPVLLLPAPPASTELTASIDHVPIAVTLTCLVIALICFIRMFCWLWGIILSMILRKPSITYFGLDYSSIQIKPLHLSIVIHDICLDASPKHELTKIFIYTLLPSANANEAKVSIACLQIRLSYCLVNPFKREISEEDNGIGKLGSRFILPLPIVQVHFEGVHVEVDKVYLSDTAKISFDSSNASLPTFDMKYWLGSMIDGEVKNANRVTFLLEQWIRHRRVEPTDVQIKTNHSEFMRTEKSAVAMMLQVMLSVVNFNVVGFSLSISGAGSDVAKSVYNDVSVASSDEMALALAKSRYKATTIIKCARISLTCLTFSCDVGVILDGTEVSVSEGGVLNPLVSSTTLSLDLLEFRPIVLSDYSFFWISRGLRLTLSSSEQTDIHLDSKSLHTAYCHLDDYLDGRSAFNVWLSNAFEQYLANSIMHEEELSMYRRFYKERFASSWKAEGKQECEVMIPTNKKIEAFEKRMSRNQLLRERAIAMQDLWNVSEDVACQFVADGMNATLGSILELFDDEYRLQSTLFSINLAFRSVSLNIPEKWFVRYNNFAGEKSDRNTNQLLTKPVSTFLLKGIDAKILLRSTLSSQTPLSKELDFTLYRNEHRSSDILYTKLGSDYVHANIQVGSIYWAVTNKSKFSPKDVLIQKGRLDGLHPVIYIDIGMSNKQSAHDSTIDTSHGLTLDNKIKAAITIENLLVSISPYFFAANDVLDDLNALPVRRTCDVDDINANYVTRSGVKDHYYPGSSLSTTDHFGEAGSKFILYRIPVLQGLFPSSNFFSSGICLSQYSGHVLPLADAIPIFGCISFDVAVDIKDSSILCSFIGEDHLLLELQARSLQLSILHKNKSESIDIDVASVSFGTAQIRECKSRSNSIYLEKAPFKDAMTMDSFRLSYSSGFIHSSKCNKREGPNKKVTSMEASSHISVMLSFKFGRTILNVTPSLTTIVLAYAEMASAWAIGKHSVKMSDKKGGRASIYPSLIERRRQTLRDIWDSIDTEHSDALNRSQITEIFLRLVEHEQQEYEYREEGICNKASKLTTDELEREVNHLYDTVDINCDDTISWDEFECAIFTKMETRQFLEGIKWGANLNEKDQLSTNDMNFLSRDTLRGIVQFEDLREFSSSVISRSITGSSTTHSFAPPCSWKENGEKLFWDIYNRETGCSKKSLNGQDIQVVQNKLVHVLCNYRFAKFCWKSLVEPNLQEATAVSTHLCDTGWTLDESIFARNDLDTLDRLVCRLNEVASNLPVKKAWTRSCEYQISVVGGMENFIVTLGNAHEFTKPLFSMAFSAAKISSTFSVDTFSKPLLTDHHSKTESTGVYHYFSESEGGEKIGADDRSSRRKLEVNARISKLLCNAEIQGQARYLNTKHNSSEQFIEAFSLFGHVISNSSKSQNDDNSPTDDDAIAKNISIALQCPQFVNINVSPSSISTTSLLQRLLNESTKCQPTYTLHGSSNRKSSMGKIEILNSTGNTVKFSCEGITDKNEGKHQFVRVECDRSRQFFLRNGPNNILPKQQHHISLQVPGFSAVHGIPLSAFQHLIVPLTKTEKQFPRNKGKKRTHEISQGFDPCIIVAPHADALENLKLEFRSSLVVEAHTSISIQVVRLPRSCMRIQGRFRKSAVSALRKDLPEVLRHLCADAPIVFSIDNVDEGGRVPIPLQITTSKSMHVMFVSDSGEGSQRTPIMLTKEFIFNTSRRSEITKFHRMGGFVIERDRLNFCSRPEIFSSDQTTNRTGYDTRIKVVPSFTFTNAMPIDIALHIVQKVGEGNDFVMTKRLSKGCDLKIGGINRDRPIQMKLIESIGNISNEDQQEKLIEQFSKIQGIELLLQKLRSGGNLSGPLSLPKINGYICADFHLSYTIETSVDRNGSIRCSLYSSYWISNKSGLRLQYKFDGRDESAYGSGDDILPVLGDCVDTNNAFSVSRNQQELSVIPIEGGSHNLLEQWWDSTECGQLSSQSVLLRRDGKALANWSESISLNAVGTLGQILCGNIVLGVSIETLTGIFHRSNSISFVPRFIVQNSLHVDLSILCLYGLVNDAKGYASSNISSNSVVKITQTESTAIYSFHDISKYSVGTKKRFLCVCSGSSAQVNLDQSHIVLVDEPGRQYFNERSGKYGSIGKIIGIEVSMAGPTMMIRIFNASFIPPYRLENRSSEFYLQFVQDDAAGEPVELPPMTWCGYAFDNPYGKRRVRAVALTRCDSNEYFMTGRTREPSVLKGADKCEQTTALGDNFYSILPFVDRKRMFSLHSRCYSVDKMGSKQKKLPVPRHGPDLFPEVRILDGSKVLSFNDSSQRFDQLEEERSRIQSTWSNMSIDVALEGFALNCIDDFPHEILTVTLRGFHIFKRSESLEFIARLRHYQIDAMLASARYPIILQPVPFGLDERKSVGINDLANAVPTKEESKDFDADIYWVNLGEKPQPALELSFSYFPQKSMIWLPKMELFLLPVKVQVDLSYLLQIIDLVVDSLPERMVYSNAATNAETAAALANAHTKLVSPHMHGKQDFVTYMENFKLDPTWIDLELDIKPVKSLGSLNTSSSTLVERDDGGEAILALGTMGSTAKSRFTAALLSWVTNVAASFAHISPRFKFSHLSMVDHYCNAEEIPEIIFRHYMSNLILQSYKVLFSMHVLGDPTQLVEQIGTGLTDFVTITREEILAGGKKGFGKGFNSLVQNVVGGPFLALSKATGSFADIVFNLSSNEYTIDVLQVLPLSTPQNVGDGIVEGFIYITKSIVNGVVGVGGNPYRSLQKRSPFAFGRGLLSGFCGLATSPFLAILGFIAKVSEGINATTHMCDRHPGEARCRPSRNVTWGGDIGPVEIPMLNAVGIRIHGLRWMVKRKGSSLKSLIVESDNANMRSSLSVKEEKHVRKELRKAERARKNPRAKVVSVRLVGDSRNKKYKSSKAKPKLLSQSDAKKVEHLFPIDRIHSVDCYHACFEETIKFQNSDLQFSDTLLIEVWDARAFKSIGYDKLQSLCSCSISFGDICNVLDTFHKENRTAKSICLKKSVHQATESMETGDDATHDIRAMNTTNVDDSDITVSPQVLEFALMVPSESASNRKTSNIGAPMLSTIQDELQKLEPIAEDTGEAKDYGGRHNGVSIDSCEDDDDSDSPHDKGSARAEKHEKLFGYISLSFVPIEW